MSGGVYINSEAHWEFISKVMFNGIKSNPLHVDEFFYTNQLEAEIIRMTLTLYKGDKQTCGVVTSGGTESILLSMLAYREWGRHKGIKKPNVVASETAHAAFDKACFYFGMEMRKVPMKNKRCNV